MHTCINKAEFNIALFRNIVVLSKHAYYLKHSINIFLCFLICAAATAQYPFTIKIQSPDPLPTPVIYDMLADTQGYIWLATDKGLIKFNSRTYAILPFNSTQSKSLGYINQDPQGTIWCMNYNKQIFYVQHDSLKLFEVIDNLYNQHVGLLNMNVSDKYIYISSLKLIVEIDKKRHKILRSITKPNTNSFYQHSTIFNDSLIYFNRKNELCNLQKTIRHVDSTNQFFELRFTTDNTVLLAIERGKRERLAFVFDGKNITQLPDYNIPKDAYVYHLSCTGKNEFWLCTQYGAYLWNYATGNTTHIFPDERVSDVVKDFQGNYWFSTLDNGLYKCPNINCVKIESPFSSINNNATKVIKLHNGSYIFGNTKGEIALVDKNLKNKTKFNSANKEEIEFLFANETEKKLYCDAGLFSYETGKQISGNDFGKGVTIDAFDNIIYGSFSRCIVTTSDYSKVDTNTVPTNCALYKNLKNTYVKIFKETIKKAKLLRERRTHFTLANSNKNGFWVAYDDNLFYYNYTGKIDTITNNQQPIIATHLLQHNNQLYVSTTTNGLLVLSAQNKIINHFNTQTGLQSNAAKKTIFNSNNIWLLTDESLEIIDLHKNVIQEFFSSTGLESLTVYDFAIDSNKIILATPNGIMFYNQTPNAAENKINVTQLMVLNNNKSIDNNAVLSYYENSISIKIDAIHYKAPNKLYFHYKLKGSTDDWQTVAASNNIVNYNFLPAGNYVFEVYAADVNNLYKSNVKTFSFTISKPFWQTWWFICLVVISILIIGVLCIRYWAYRFKTKQQAKENLLHSKLTAIRSQMNPHFLYNVLNTVQGLVYGNKKTEAAEMLGDFSDLMRKTLQESDKTEIALQDEINTLKLYLSLEQKRFTQDFEFSFLIDSNIATDEIYIPSMFVQPFIENAIKHGLLHKQGLKILTINIQQQQNNLFISIEDNGIGRKQSAVINQNKKIKSTGFAIKGVEERINIYNQMNQEKISFDIVDKEEGTLVKLCLPVMNSD